MMSKFKTWSVVARASTLISENLGLNLNCAAIFDPDSFIHATLLQFSQPYELNDSLTINSGDICLRVCFVIN